MGRSTYEDIGLGGEVIATEDGGEAIVSAVNGTAIAKGRYGTARASGFDSHAIAEGDDGVAIADGKYCTAIATGENGKVMGTENGAQLFLVRVGYDNNVTSKWYRVVGKSGIKPNIYYSLGDGGSAIPVPEDG